MDAEQIRRLEPMLWAYLGRFDDCFARADTRRHLAVYVGGQLSDLERKSVQPIATRANYPVRTLQEFLTLLRWDEDRMRDRMQQIVAQEHAHQTSIGVIDETSWVKKGNKTPGVQRQYCGSLGKKDNCIVTVHLAYAAGDFHCLLDGDLFLPENWHQDRKRCREAGIPDEVVYRPKTEIALELYDRAVANGVRFAWLTFDAWYGSKPPFLRALDERKQNFVGEVHKDFTAWIDAPAVTQRPYRRGKQGRRRRTPRLLSGSPCPQTVQQLARRHPALRDQAWRAWRVKDGQKGPIVWEVKHTLVHLRDEQALPSRPYRLLVCRNPLTRQTKYFLSNAAPTTPVKTLLHVAFNRWRIERSFEDSKGELGLDHWEGRRWIGLKRHLILTAVSYLFLARARQWLAKKNPEVTVCQLRAAVNALISSWSMDPAAAARHIQRTAKTLQYIQRRNAQARQSHTKTTKQRLTRLGIKLSHCKRCHQEHELAL